MRLAASRCTSFFLNFSATNVAVANASKEQITPALRNCAANSLLSFASVWIIASSATTLKAESKKMTKKSEIAAQSALIASANRAASPKIF